MSARLVLVALVALASLPLVGCDDGAPEPAALPESLGADMSWSEVRPTPESTTGWVAFELQHSTCPAELNGGWEGEYYAFVSVEEDVVTMELPMLPTLTGELDDGGEAALEGEVTWMDAEGKPVLCEVAGQGAMADSGEMSGEVTETLSSDGSFNCQTTVTFTLTP